MTTEEFKSRIAAIIGREEKNAGDRPCVRGKGQSGYYPAPPMNADPTKPTTKKQK